MASKAPTAAEKLTANDTANLRWACLIRCDRNEIDAERVLERARKFEAYVKGG